MSFFPWPSFDPKLTWDGLLTFLGGVLAFFAILYQVRRADQGLQKQLNVEKQARQDEAEDRRRRVAIALLFEIDDHYKSNVRDLVKYLEEHANDPSPTVIKSTNVNPFPVYVGNVNMLGALPPCLVEVIVNYYGLLRVYVATFNHYSQGYEMWLAGNSSIGRALMKSLVPKIKSEAAAITQLTYITCGLLCDFVGTSFSYPRIGVESDPHVEESTRASLLVSRKQLAEETARA